MGESQARLLSADQQNVITNCVSGQICGYQTREPRLEIGSPLSKTYAASGH